jgi:neutral ceramidase
VNGTGLQVGFSAVDITPPIGLLMCGGLDPRKNVGTEDPLLVKTLVVAGETEIAVVGVDLIGLPRTIVDRAIDEAARRTHIERGAILVSCSHTHSGPYTMEGLYSFGVTDPDYLSTLPGAIADSVEAADAVCQPAKMYIGRSLVHHGLHHRRVLCKDGADKPHLPAYNTWMRAALDDLETCPQVLGSCGPIDPELWVVRFDGLDGKPLGTFVNLALHVNTHFGTTWSADYPGVIAERMRRELGPDAATVFTPGACANINATMSGTSWREGAEYLAGRAVEAVRRAKRIDGPIAVDAVRRDVAVSRRDPESQPPEAIGRLTWGGGSARQDVFGPQIEHVAAMPEQLLVPVSAARIGPFAIATNAGELFVEHGLAIKERSPFPHTVVAELTNDLIMYQPTREAFEQQGYETLVGPNRVSVEGIEELVETAVELLHELWAKQARSK